MLADPRPFCGVLWRLDAVAADFGVVLYCHAEAEERLDAALDKLPDEDVREGEIVVCGVVLVGVEVAEEVRYIDEDVAAVGPAGVMEAGERDAGLGEVAEHPPVARGPDQWRLPDAVYRLHRPDGGAGIDGDGHGGVLLLSACCRGYRNRGHHA